MVDRPLVIVLGDSLLMEGAAVSLADCPQLSLIRLDSTVIDIWQQVDSLNPDAIVFELNIPQAANIFSLLKERPGILLIGLDLESSRVIVLNSRQEFTRTMHDLYQIVEVEVGEKVRFSIEGEFVSSLAKMKSGAASATSR